jgi:retinoblastoma-like protein 1
MVWEKDSSLYSLIVKGSSLYSLIVARPCVALEIKCLGLLAEPMSSLNDLVTRQNIHVQGLPATPSKKLAAGPDDNADPQSPNRSCNESRNTVVERNLQTSPPKQTHMVSTSLKAIAANSSSHLFLCYLISFLCYVTAVRQ